MTTTPDTARAGDAGIAALAGRLPGGLPALSGCIAILRRLERTSLAAQLDLLHRHDALDETRWVALPDIVAATRAAPRHVWLLRRWLVALTAAGVLEANGTRWRERPGHGLRTEGNLAANYAALGFPAGLAQLHRSALDGLGRLLRDEMSLQALLFADGRIVESLANYQDNPFTAYVNAACADVLRQCPGSGGVLRVLELGGGPGLATACHLHALREREIDYHFTDVSRLFTQAARERHGDRGMRYGLLDIDADFAAQGVPPHGADAIVAGNTLHNAHNIDATLARIGEALAPGGWLLFTEAMADNVAMLTSMQFLLSPPPGRPLPGSGDGRAVDGDIFLDARRWRERLHAAGFEVLAALPGDNDDVACGGQGLIVARRRQAYP